MTKKFIIKEAWIIDQNTNQEMKLKLLEKNDIPDLLEVEKIRSGHGDNILNKLDKYGKFHGFEFR